MSYRCDSCGNKTRFDIEETKRVRSFHHFSLAGEDAIEEEEILERNIEKITCRWCGSSDAIVEESALDVKTVHNVSRD
jgi:DNA-directed RNA polymerase subunit RPC12/RpoP